MSRPLDLQMPNEQELRRRQQKYNEYDLTKLVRAAGETRNTIDSIFVHYAYRKNFGDKVVHFDVNGDQTLVMAYPDRILVSERMTCFIYLKLFNKSISNVLILYTLANANAFDRYVEINRVISKFCASNLQTIAFKCAQPMRITLQGFEERFREVKIIRMKNVNLDNQLPEFVARFPNTRRLELNEVSMIDNGIRWPNLIELEITYALERTRDRLNEVRSLLHSNSTLLRLHIEMPMVDDMNMDFLLDIIDRNTLLKKLIVKTNLVNEPVTEEQIYRLVRYFGLEFLNLSSFRMVRELATYLWNQLRRLKTFSTRIVKYKNLNEGRILTRFVRTDTGHEIVPPILRFGTMPCDDPVTFRRS